MEYLARGTQSVSLFRIALDNLKYTHTVFTNFNHMLTSRHAESRDHAAIGRGNVFKLRKGKGWNTIEFVETVSLNSMNDHLFA